MWYVTVYSRDNNPLFGEEILIPLQKCDDSSWMSIIKNQKNVAIVVDDVDADDLQNDLADEGVLCLFVGDEFKSLSTHTISSLEIFPNHTERSLHIYLDWEMMALDDDKIGEFGFLNLCHDILVMGKDTRDRTGVGTLSLFSPQIVSYNLSDNQVPCFTTKKVAWKNTIKELLWFISGSTDSKELEKMGINWWVGNTSREFLDGRGLSEYEEGELGPMYGHVWRHQGAVYRPQKVRHLYDDHGKGGVDQLSRLIENIKAVKNGDPTNARRLLMTTYIPQDLEKAVLEPCHTFVQFHVDGEYLESVLYQRSGDMFLGVQINILSYSILTHMIADVCGLKARRFHHHIGDAHIYKNHIVPMVRQILRCGDSGGAPTLVLQHRDNIDDFVIDDFSLEGYHPKSGIKAPMAV